MILSRLSEAIREQNWFTVIIEISVVVVGIFIGLQADAWNQDRLDRQEERGYLLRDLELRDTLAKYYREIDRWEVILSGEQARSQFDDATAGLLDSDQLIAIENSNEQYPDLPGASPQAALESAQRFSVMQEAFRYLPQMLLYHVLADEVMSRHEQSARALLEELEAALGSDGQAKH